MQSRQPVLLRGVNRSGLEYSSPDGSGSLSKTGLNERDFDEMACEWHANIIRLPFNQEWALSQKGMMRSHIWLRWITPFRAQHNGALTLAGPAVA